MIKDLVKYLLRYVPTKVPVARPEHSLVRDVIRMKEALLFSAHILGNWLVYGILWRQR